MLLKKEGMPQESELVLCTVTKIQFNSVFANLDEYPGKHGMIHISEISPGRIRNIRDYVKEGKKVVCVILRINIERGHIDLSLRRVNKNQQRKKNEQIKKEMKAEKIIEFIAKQAKLKTIDLYKEIMSKISDEYEYLADFFEDFVADNAKLDVLGLDKDMTKNLEEVVRQRVTLPTVIISGNLIINVFESNGVEIIKKALEKAEKIDKEQIQVYYLGAGKYDLKIESEDYKTAEKLLKKVNDSIEKSFKKVDGNFEFVRDD